MASPSRVIVIGAGWTGLAAAKTYLQINPDVSLTIIDEDSSVGGVWSASRVYPGLVADSCAAIFDYSDFPMDVELDLDKWADLPAEKVHQYLEQYTDKFDLRKRCKLNTKVMRVERDETMGEGAIWKVEIEVRKDFEEYPVTEVMLCDKLIVATGVTSTPNIPEGLDWKEFAGPVMHSKDIGQKNNLLTADNVKRVTVVGGSKSSIDVVFLCALAGKEVDWVIREDGYGPILLFEPRSHGIHAGAIKNIRATTLISPSPFITEGFWYRFLHSGKSKLGSKLLNAGFEKQSNSAIKDFYGKNEHTLKIAPDMKNMFWQNCGISVVHDMKFMSLVAEDKLIHVHRTSIASISKDNIALKNGLTLPSNALVFATGWKPNQSPIFAPSLLPSLGLQYPLTFESPESPKHYEVLDRISEQKIKDLFPMLAHLPKHVQEYDAAHMRKQTHTPLRLFRNIAPPTLTARHQHDIIILGTLLNTAVPTYAEISSLWGVAYLENLPFAPSTTATLSSLEDMEKEVSLLNAWGWVRYRDRSISYLDGSVEIQNFMDQLMTDLGLEAARKKRAQRKRGQLIGLRGMVKEWLWPYMGGDYKGLVEEYIERWGLKKEDGKKESA